MIVERKQYGCIQVLLVQIGLALYLIVLFLGTSPTGEVKPQVLRVQKVAEAGKQATISALLPQVSQLKLSAPSSVAISGTDTVSTTDSTSTQNKLAVTAYQQVQDQHILNLIGDSIIAHTQIASSQEIPTDTLAAVSIAQDQSVEIPELHSLYTIGSKPRAPTTA